MEMAPPDTLAAVLGGSNKPRRVTYSNKKLLSTSPSANKKASQWK